METFKSSSEETEVWALIPLLPLQGKWSHGKSLHCQHQYHHGSWKAEVAHPPGKNKTSCLICCREALTENSYWGTILLSDPYSNLFLPLCNSMSITSNENFTHVKSQISQHKPHFPNYCFFWLFSGFFSGFFLGFFWVFFHPLRESHHSSAKMKQNRCSSEWNKVGKKKE